MLRLLCLTLLGLTASLIWAEQARGADQKDKPPAIEVTVDTSQCPELDEWPGDARVPLLDQLPGFLCPPRPAWLERKHDKDIVPVLNTAMRRGKYSDELFRTRTGKSLDALWAAFLEAVRVEEKTPRKRAGA
jgi:hypothetical protein